MSVFYYSCVPVSAPQSYLRYPLTGLLGTAGNVRVLRELALHGGALGTAALARGSGLTVQQVRRTLADLQARGIIDVLGNGHARLFRLRRGHPLSPALEQLFGAEADAFRGVWEQLASAAALVAPPPYGVWLYGSSARGEDRPGSDIDVVVVSDEPRKAANKFRMTLRLLEEESGLSAAVVGLDLADVARLAAGHDPWWDNLLRDAKLLAGALPSAVLERALAAPVRA